MQRVFESSAIVVNSGIINLTDIPLPFSGRYLLKVSTVYDLGVIWRLQKHSNKVLCMDKMFGSKAFENQTWEFELCANVDDTVDVGFVTTEAPSAQVALGQNITGQLAVTIDFLG